MRRQAGVSPARSGFDKLAHVYRWLEYASFGPLLQRTRVRFLPSLAGARRVLVLGDGDGRFCVTLLRQQPGTHAVAVDASAGMLQRLLARAASAGVDARLTTLHQDATISLPAGPFDAVCTHFFLDCLSDCAVLQLATAVRNRYPEARWIVSEFAVPPGLARWPAWLAVRALYAGFRVLAGLQPQRLPDYAAALRRSGYTLHARHNRLFGLLRAELWYPAAAEALVRSRDAS